MRRLHPGNPFDAHHRRILSRDNLFYAGKVRAGFASHVRRELVARMHEAALNRYLPVRESLGEKEKNPMGAYRGRNENLCVAKT